jgi:hypothetical protein
MILSFYAQQNAVPDMPELCLKDVAMDVYMFNVLT